MARVNTFSGATHIALGKVFLGPSSWMSNSPSITLSNNQVLDGTAFSGGIVVGASQTLLGGGLVSGAVTTGRGRIRGGMRNPTR